MPFGHGSSANEHRWLLFGQTFFFFAFSFFLHVAFHSECWSCCSAIELQSQPRPAH